MRRTRQSSRCASEERAYRSRVTHKHRHNRSTEEVFKCKNCRRFIGHLPSGGHHRNHCPFCLFSRHVDGKTSGDRASQCGARMEPIGYFQRKNGEYVLVHHCLGCGLERINRVAADDYFDLVLSLPLLPARTGLEMKLHYQEVFLQEDVEAASLQEEAELEA